MSLIGYARVSTGEQHPEAQQDALTAVGCERVFTDHGVSGKLASRPQWDAALAYLRPGDTLVITKLDRAGRSTRHLLEIAETLRERGIELRVLNLGIDTGTPAGRLMFTVLAGIAEFERDLLVERTHEGLAAARARGRVGGRKPKLTARQAETAARMHRDGHSITAIAETFNVTRPTIYAVLERHQRQLSAP